MKNPWRYILSLAASILVLLASCSRAQAQAGSVRGSVAASPLSSPLPVSGIKLSFIELGSVNCIPCKAMQPIMESVRLKYPDQVEVIFHDVWTPEGRPFGDQYGIRVIPTQVFLDAEGKEYFRHEGFFPEEELVAILVRGGLKP